MNNSPKNESPKIAPSANEPANVNVPAGKDERHDSPQPVVQPDETKK